MKSSGVIPQITCVLGPCAGGAVYSPAMTDFIFMVKGVSNMFITGPDVIKTVTGEEVTHEELGGAMIHATKSGVATFVADDERRCIEQVRYLLSFLPVEQPRGPAALRARPTTPSAAATAHSISSRTSPNRAYDMKDVIAEIVDDGDFFEVLPALGHEHRLRLRAHRRSRRRHRRQPAQGAGRLRSTSTRRRRRRRFVRTCDAFNIPLVTFVDVPGFLPGTDQEYGGIIRHGAKLLYAYCEATVPRVQSSRARVTAARTSS